LCAHRASSVTDAFPVLCCSRAYVQVWISSAFFLSIAIAKCSRSRRSLVLGGWHSAFSAIERSLFSHIYYTPWSEPDHNSRFCPFLSSVLPAFIAICDFIALAQSACNPGFLTDVRVLHGMPPLSLQNRSSLSHTSFSYSTYLFSPANPLPNIAH
jgi:hypothetical protein